MKNIKNVDDINDLRFTITEDMSNMFIEIITIRQMLKENKLNKKDKALLEKELKELTTLFILEFRKHNIRQRKKYYELMNN